MSLVLRVKESMKNGDIFYFTWYNHIAECACLHGYMQFSYVYMCTIGAGTRLPHTREAAHICTCLVVAQKSGSRQKVIRHAMIVHPPRFWHAIERETWHGVILWRNAVSYALRYASGILRDFVASWFNF